MTATVEPSAAAEHEIGKARVRKEDDHLITGRTRWTDNIVLPGMLHIAILRSPMAHARIASIDAEAAKQMPGVVAVYTGADLAEEQASLPNAMQITPDMKVPPAPSSAACTTILPLLSPSGIVTFATVTPFASPGRATWSSSGPASP